MIRIARFALSVSTLAIAVACASATGATTSLSSSSPSPVRGDNSNGESQQAETPCSDCSAAAVPISGDLTRAVESRIAELKARGGECSRIGAVLETSYRSGQITLRPYMWRVGTHLASGEAKPNGAITLAVQIDSLNVGVRTVDDVLWTMEHEAAHIAFDFPSGNEASEEQANQTVRACRS